MEDPSSVPGPEVAQVIDPNALLPVLRRVVHARLSSPDDAEDVVQEALAKVIAAAERIDPATAEGYAITTARNLLASRWRDAMRFRERRHQLVDVDHTPEPEDLVLQAESKDVMARALQTLSEADRELLIAHELQGVPNTELARRFGSSPGAIGARLHRIRARMRVEVLLATEGVEPATPSCRTVLVAIASKNRRRQREADVETHLLECDQCGPIADQLMDDDADAAVRIDLEQDADLVHARQKSREVAAQLGFAKAELTVIATAVSEIARNILNFAGSGRLSIGRASDDDRTGIRIAGHDRGPGIADVDEAMRDGFSTCGGLGLGLAGIQRLMDDFEITSLPGRGTRITVTKWREREDT